MATDPGKADTDSPRDLNDEIRRAFWVRHIRTGFGVFLGETLAVLIYLGLTPDEPHRFALRIITATWVVLAGAGLLSATPMASSQRRALYTASWTIASIVGVGVVAALDGGVDSPLLFLLFLPIGYAALAFEPVITGACGLASLLCIGVVALTDSRIQISPDGGLLLAAVIIGASALSVAASVNRANREQLERSLSERISVLASTDSLTGCAVHRVFHQRLSEEIARSIRTRTPLSLLMVDVDDFKVVNDTYGHLVGDHVLASIGKVLRTDTRAFETVGRLGGDEFAVLLPDTMLAEAVTVAERLRSESIKAVEVPVTLSVGISGLDLSSPTAERMLDDADFALYQVKHAGRDGITVRQPESSVSL